MKRIAMLKQNVSMIWLRSSKLGFVSVDIRYNRRDYLSQKVDWSRYFVVNRPNWDAAIFESSIMEYTFSASYIFIRYQAVC